MKQYTIDLYCTKDKSIIDLKLKPMSYKQARTFKKKFSYRKHFTYRLRRLK